MAAIAVSESSLGAVKKALRENFTDEKSSHLTEALAVSLGFQTHAALLAAVAKDVSDPRIVLLDSERFVSRLVAFGYPRNDKFDFEFLAHESSPVISTVPENADGYRYTTAREKAWAI